MKFNYALTLLFAALTVSGLQAQDEAIFRGGRHQNNDRHDKRDNKNHCDDRKDNKHDWSNHCFDEKSCHDRKDDKHDSKDHCFDNRHETTWQDNDWRHDRFEKDHNDKNCCNGNKNHRTNGVLRIGLFSTSPEPFTIFTTVNNVTTATGFDVSIWCALCHCLNRECRFVRFGSQADALAAVGTLVDVVGTSIQFDIPIVAPSLPKFNWLISRIIDDNTVRAYLFRADDCQLIRDAQECFNQIICDGIYDKICRNTARTSTTPFPCAPSSPTQPPFTPGLYESFCRGVVNEDCICCFFPNKPCENKKRPCEVSSCTVIAQ